MGKKKRKKKGPTAEHDHVIHIHVLTEEGEPFLKRSITLHPRAKVEELYRSVARYTGAPPLNQTILHEEKEVQAGLRLEDAILDPDGHNVESCAVTLLIDEATRYIATGSVDRTALLWNAETGEQIREFKGHINSINTVAFDSDGSKLLTASDDHTARLWSSMSGEVLCRFIEHSWAVNSAAFSPDDYLVCTASHDRTIKLWKAAAMTQGQSHSHLTIEGHEASVSSAAFSKDGQSILSASHDRTAVLWDAETGDRKLTFVGHKDMVFNATFSKSGSLVLTASGDRTARLWCAESASCLQVFRGDHKGCVIGASFSQDDSMVLTTCEDHVSCRSFNIDSGECRPICRKDTSRGKRVGNFTNYAGPYNSAAYSWDGSAVLAASIDRTAKIFDAEAGTLAHALRGHGGGVVSAAWAPEQVEKIPEPEPSEPEDFEFDIHLNTLDGTGHGMDLQPDVSCRRLLITGINGGQADKWNKKRPFDKVLPGDFILSVNGVDRYSDAILAEINMNKELEITLLREVCYDVFNEAVLDASGDDEYGWELCDDGGGRVEVDCIFGGLVEKWNRVYKEKENRKILAKDIIYEVNGITSSYDLICEELNKKHVMNLRLVREAPKDLYFDIVLDRSNDAPLGMQLIAAKDNESLHIDTIDESLESLIAIWNKAHPKRQVIAGDVIVEVNGIRFNASRMLEVCPSDAEDASAVAEQTVAEESGRVEVAEVAADDSHSIVAQGAPTQPTAIEEVRTDAVERAEGEQVTVDAEGAIEEENSNLKACTILNLRIFRQIIFEEEDPDEELEVETLVDDDDEDDWDDEEDDDD